MLAPAGTQDSPFLGIGAAADFSLFVGDLAMDVDDALLEGTFARVYASVRSAKVGAGCC